MLVECHLDDFPYLRRKMSICLLRGVFMMPQYSMSAEQKPIYYLLLLFIVLAGSVGELRGDLQTLA